MTFQVVYDGTPLVAGVRQEILRFQSPISALRLEVRSDVTASGQLDFAVYGYASMEGIVNGLERPIIGTGVQPPLFPTNSFIKNYQFDTPVSRVILYSNTLDSPKLYVAVLDETKA